MRRPMRPLIAGAVLLLVAGTAGGQPCAGDCDGDGRVSISELILSVNIALGVLPISMCPTATPPLGIDKLIASVNSALCDCRPCPTPPPSPTRTATSTPTATSMPSPTPTPIMSTWREDNGRLASTNCRREINDIVREDLPRNCVYSVSQQGAQVTLVDCGGFVIEGTIDAQGVVRVRTQGTESEAGCTVTLDLQFAVNLSRSPSQGTYDFAWQFTNCGQFRDCAQRVTSRWTRLSSSARATVAGGVVGRPGAARRALARVVSP